MKYDLLLVDAPWKYDNGKSANPKYGGKEYACMTNKELAEIPFADIASENALMFCWFTMPKLKEGLQLMEHWGFVPRTCGFVWVKINQRGTVQQSGRDTILHDGIYSGLGSYTCGNVELCYIGKRGKGVPRQDKAVKQVVFAPVGRHSAKPVEVHKRIDRLYASQYQRVEFFARDQPYASHWTATGREYDGANVYDFIRDNL